MECIKIDMTQDKTSLIKELHENFKKHGPCEFIDTSSEDLILTCELEDLSEVPADILEAYVRDVTEGSAEEWYDDENPYAGPEAYAMVLKDINTMPLYIEFLNGNDMDHEVYQMEYIDDIIETHGINGHTLNLLAARMGSCIGQHGMEQVPDIWEEHEIDDLLLENEELRNEFIVNYTKSQFVWTTYELSRELKRGATMGDFTEAYKTGEINIWEDTFLEDLEEVVDEELFEIIQTGVNAQFLLELEKCDPSLEAYDIHDWIRA